MRSYFRLLTGGIAYSPEYAYEMASSNVRFGRGSTNEIGEDVTALGFRGKLASII
jgi:hypothetical protein